MLCKDCKEKGFEKPSACCPKPTAWLHILGSSEGMPGNYRIKKLTFFREHPFGVSGIDYRAEFTIVSVPLYGEL